MCTALISIDPWSRVPVLVLFARDELAERDWLPPGAHWPETHPGLVGGYDVREGGTWLAVQPGGYAGPRRIARPRIAFLLNAFGRPAPAEKRLTRGRLPLAAASGALVHQLDLPRYDPFHLLVAEENRVRMLTWDGSELVDKRLAAGTHMVSNRGIENGGPFPDAPQRAVDLISARIAHFRPLLTDAPRPEPLPDSGPTAEAWGPWMRLADGDGLDPSDPRALIGRHDWGPGQAWLTSSVTLLALGDRGVRYDVNLRPGTDEWSQVEAAADPAAAESDPAATGDAGPAAAAAESSRPLSAR